MPKTVPFKLALKHKTVIVGFVVLRLQDELVDNPRAMDVNWLAAGHGYSLTLQRAVFSALAGVAAKDAIATAIAAIARPKILVRCTGLSLPVSRLSHFFRLARPPNKRRQLSTRRFAITQEIFRICWN